MKEPRRLVEDSDAEDGLRELVRHARPSRAITIHERQRGARRLAVATTTAAGLLLWAKGPAFAALLGATLGVGVATGLPRLIEATSSPPQASAVAPSINPPKTPMAPATIAPTTTPPAKRDPTELPRAAAVRVPAVKASESVNGPSAELTPSDTLSAEAELIERARRALAGDPKNALALLDEHRTSFPSGKLGMERELLRVDALRRAGRTSDARQHALALLARSEKGIYATRLRQLLAELGGTEP